MSRQRLLPSSVILATMGMEMCCLYLGLLLVRQFMGLVYVSFTIMMLLYPLSLGMRMVSDNLDGAVAKIAPLARALLIALTSVVAGLAIWQAVTVSHSVGAVILVLGFCALAWWLGNSLVHARTSYSFVCFRVQMSVLFLLIFAGAGSFPPVIIALILAAYALSRARWEGSASTSKGILQAFPLGPIVLGTLAVLVPAALVFFVVSPEIAGDILNWFIRVWTGFYAWFYAVMSSDFWQKPIVDWDFSCRCPFENITEKPPAPPPPLPEGTGMPEWVLWAIFGVLLVFVFMSVRHFRIRRKATAAKKVNFEATSMQVSLFREILNALKAFIKWLWHTLLVILRQVRLTHPAPVQGGPVRSVREVYRRLLDWASMRAILRQRSQTPLEYLKVLCHEFAAQGEEFSLITNTYLRARYSGRDPTPEDFEKAREAWQKVQLASQTQNSG